MKAYEMLKRFIMDESGLETVEWAIIAAIISAAVITAIAAISTNVKTKFQNLETATGQ
jgi:Flp pilus assembly pilin Flp